MPVALNSIRKLAEVSWDPGNDNEDKVTLVAVNPADGKEHTRKGLVNDGLAEVAFPVDYHGPAHIQILDPDGEVIDEGDINV